MAFIVRTLYSEAVGSTGIKQYIVGGEKSAMVNSVRVVNESDTNSATLSFYVKPSGTSTARLIAKRNQSLAAKASLVLEDVVTLGKGDALQMEVSGTSPSLGWTVYGVERE